MIYDDAKAIISERIKIQDVLRRYTNCEIDRHNRCACPLHGGENHNFTVYPKTNSFYCFACGAGGDVIKFVSLYLNISYGDAIKKLDEDYGLNLLKKSHKSYNARVKEAEKIRRKAIEKEAFKRSQRQDYDLMINYFKWLGKQPQTVEIQFDIDFIEQLLDKHLNLEKCPITYDVKALLKALYTKHEGRKLSGTD